MKICLKQRQGRTDLLGSGVTASQWDFDRYWNDARVKTAVKGANEADGVAIRVNQGNPSKKRESVCVSVNK